MIKMTTSNHCSVDKSNVILSFNSGLAYGIHIISGTENYYNAQFDGIFTVNAMLDDVALATTSNVTGLRGHNKYRTTAQAIPDTTLTAAVYMTTGFDTDDFASAGGATIPVDEGMRRARVCAGGVWAASATGWRFIEIRMNGTGFYAGKPRLRQPAVAAGVHEQTVCSGYLNIIDGDAFQVIYAQTSGGDLDITDTWFTLEVLN